MYITSLASSASNINVKNTVYPLLVATSRKQPTCHKRPLSCTMGGRL